MLFYFILYTVQFEYTQRVFDDKHIPKTLFFCFISKEEREQLLLRESNVNNANIKARLTFNQTPGQIGRGSGDNDIRKYNQITVHPPSDSDELESISDTHTMSRTRSNTRTYDSEQDHDHEMSSLFGFASVTTTTNGASGAGTTTATKAVTRKTATGGGNYNYNNINPAQVRLLMNATNNTNRKNSNNIKISINSKNSKNSRNSRNSGKNTNTSRFTRWASSVAGISSSDNGIINTAVAVKNNDRDSGGTGLSLAHAKSSKSSKLSKLSKPSKHVHNSKIKSKSESKSKLSKSKSKPISTSKSKSKIVHKHDTKMIKHSQMIDLLLTRVIMCGDLHNDIIIIVGKIFKLPLNKNEKYMLIDDNNIQYNTLEQCVRYILIKYLDVDSINRQRIESLNARNSTDVSIQASTAIELWKLCIDSLSLVQKSILFAHGCDVRNRKYHGVEYEQVFVGKEAVEWLIDHQFCINKEKAIEFGNGLWERGYFKHIKNEHKFKDKHYFYRFNWKLMVQNETYQVYDS